MDRGKDPRNIILVIGEGLGLAQVTSAQYSRDASLHLTEFPVTGLQVPGGVDSPVPGPIAGANALGIGIPDTYRGLGLDSEGRPVPTLLEKIRKKKAIGLLTTAPLTHPTVAALYGHVAGVHDENGLLMNLIDLAPDCVMGIEQEAWNAVLPNKETPLDRIKARGYSIFQPGQPPWGMPDKPVDSALVFTEKRPDAQADYLLDAFSWAIHFLQKKNEDGFFLVVHSDRIARAALAGDAGKQDAEVVQLDRLAGRAMAFARTNAETLVIVTAIQEYGGFTLLPGETLDTLTPFFATENENGTLLPIYASGPGDRFFTGIYPSTDIHFRLLRAVALLPDSDSPD